MHIHSNIVSIKVVSTWTSTSSVRTSLHARLAIAKPSKSSDVGMPNMEKHIITGIDCRNQHRYLMPYADVVNFRRRDAKLPACQHNCCNRWRFTEAWYNSIITMATWKFPRKHAIDHFTLTVGVVGLDARRSRGAAARRPPRKEQRNNFTNLSTLSAPLCVF